MNNKYFNKYWRMGVGALLGALAGFLYWYFIGCSSGTCPITSSPVVSSIWGAVMGGLILDMFKPKKQNNNE